MVKGGKILSTRGFYGWFATGEFFAGKRRCCLRCEPCFEVAADAEQFATGLAEELGIEIDLSEYGNKKMAYDMATRDISGDPRWTGD